MSGTYNSRVFSFIHSQTFKFKDSCAKSWRQIKVVAVWTGQALLYPFYRLAQTTKIFAAKPAPKREPRFAPPQPPADITIEAALDLIAIEGYPVQIGDKEPVPVDDWSFIDENIWDTSLAPVAIKDRSISYSASSPISPPRAVIRGVSSLLASRNLVLVTTENEILDVLTRQQQRDLQMRVSKELATKLLAGDTTQRPALAPQTASTHRELPPLPKPPHRTIAPKWWQKLLPQSISPHPILGEKSSSNPSESPLAATDNAIEMSMSASPKLPNFNDLSLVIPTNNRPAGIGSQIRELWQYYQEYMRVDLPDEVVEISTKNIDASGRDSLRQSPVQEPLLGFLRQSHLPKDLEGLRAVIKDVEAEERPDWIEIEVEDLGYARSPLARILSWLDRVMLNIENWVVKIWQAIVNSIDSKTIVK
jgi:hypothetical protein